MIKKDHRTYSYKIFDKKGKTKKSLLTRSRIRFLSKLRSATARIEDFNVYVRVSYGRKENYRGELEEFTNEGTYTNKESLMLAVEAFMEEI